MPYESSMQTKWADVATEEVDEVKIPAFLFVLCKSVTEDSSGGIHLNGTIVQRTLWEGDPPEPAENDVPYFKVDFKGVLPGGDVEERRHETKDLDNGIKMVYATINFKAAPIDVQASWSGFPFRIFKGTVELELQAKLVGGKMLCPDLCTLTTKGQKPINDVIHKLVRVKDHMSRCRSLAFVKPRPVIEICGDRRMKSKPTCPDDTFTTYPQIRLTFWLHEPTSKAVFEIFGPLLLVLVLMLVNFEQTFGFDTIDDWLEDDAVNDHSDYLANVISIGIAAVVVVPNIRRTSVISSVHRREISRRTYGSGQGLLMPEPGPEPLPEPEPEPQLEPQPEPEPAPQPEPQVGPESDPQLEPEPDRQPHPHPQPGPEPGSEPGPDSDPDPDPSPERLGLRL
eukprot:g20470.t2